MNISNCLINLIISQCTVEYNGAVGAGYWRITTPNGYLIKITAPVKSLKPSQKTLYRLLRQELRKQLKDIQAVCECDGYGQLSVYIKGMVR